MKKNHKKIVVGALAGLLALQIMIVPSSAKTTVKATVEFGMNESLDDYGVKVSKNNISPASTDFLYPSDGSMISMGINYYDLTHLASTIDDVTITEYWNFRIYAFNKDQELRGISLFDNKGNVLKYSQLGTVIPRNTSQTFTLTTKMFRYDLNYDKQITLADAQLANSFALKINSPSDLQIMLGDTNGDSTLDLNDANYILQKALGII